MMTSCSESRGHAIGICQAKWLQSKTFFDGLYNSKICIHVLSSKLLQLILDNFCLLKSLADSRRANLHTIDTLFLLKDLPDLVFLGTGQNDGCATIRSVPAVLTVLVFHGNALARTEALAISRNFFVDSDLVEADKVAHACIAAALLGLLGGVLHEAEFVSIFSRVDRDTLTLEGTEDTIRTVLLAQVLVVRIEVSALRVDSVLGRLEAVLCIINSSRLAAFRRKISENAILDQHNTKVAQLLVNPITEWLGEVVLNLVHWMLLVDVEEDNQKT